VEQLARGLEHIPYVQICKLRADSPGARYFAKDVLSVRSLPTFLMFPANNPNFFKYTGPRRDARSLLAFMNHVCNQPTEAHWQLSGTPSTGSKQADSSYTLVSTAPPVPGGVAVEQQQGGILLAGLAAGICLAAAGVWKLVGRAMESSHNAEALDQSIGKLGGLLWSLLRLRMQIVLQQPAQSNAGASDLRLEVSFPAGGGEWFRSGALAGRAQQTWHQHCIHVFHQGKLLWKRQLSLDLSIECISCLAAAAAAAAAATARCSILGCLAAACQWAIR
jgi:hypothetical protein